MTKQEAIQSGSTKAEQTSVVAWYLMGCFLAIVTIPVAHFRSPKIPPSILASHEDDETLRYFESQFIYTLKRCQVKAAWIGGLVGAALVLLMEACSPSL